MSSRVHEARLVQQKLVAESTVEFVLSLQEALPFRPGQFISVNVGQDERGDAILRSYSIASSPGGPELRLVLRLIDTGAGSRFFATLSPGQALRFTGPMGFFVNELQHPGDAVYVGTGTGIAPLYPMALETLARDEPGRVLLLWGVRHEQDRFWLRELAELRERFPRADVRIYLSRPLAQPLAKPEPAEWAALRGRLTAPLLEEVPRLRAPVFYLCGNGHMIEDIKAALQALGIHRKRQIRTESFFD